MVHPEGAFHSSMSKTKVKLDAICAKLKSLAQPDDQSLTHQDDPMPAATADHVPAKSLSKNDPDCENASGSAKSQQSILDGDVNGSEHDGGTDSIPSSRASSPPTQYNNNLTVPTPTRALTGASRRKSRKKVSRIDQTPNVQLNGCAGPSESEDYPSQVQRRRDSFDSKAPIFESSQGEYSTMHLTNGYGSGPSRSPSPRQEVAQDLSINRTVAHSNDNGSPLPRYRRDSYDPMAIADFAERSYGQEDESDLLIDEEGAGSKQVKRSEEMNTEVIRGRVSHKETPVILRTEDSYPTEPEDLSMPKAVKKGDKGRGGDSSPSHRDSGSGTTNNNKGGILYDTAAVREYAADTMKEFLGMYGYEDEQQRAERDDVRLDNFAFGQLTQENLKAYAKRPVDAFRARLEQEIRANPPKPDGGRPYDELQPQFMHMKLQRRTSSGKRKLGLHNGSQTFVKKMNLHIKGEKSLSEEEQDRSNRFSKYDYFIQKLEAGESISHDIPNTRISKYDSYIHQLNQGNSIEKVIGKREMELQKPPGEISPRMRQKQSSPVGSQSNAPGQGAPRAHMGAHPSGHSGGSEYDTPMVTLAQSMFPGGAPYPILAPIPGMPLPAMMAGPLGAMNLSGRMELGLGPQSGSLPGPRPPSTDSNGKGPGSEPSQSGLFKRSLLSGAATERDEPDSVNEPVKGFSKYIARYAANENCSHCGFHYKEHFHCMEEECSFARFTRKEDVMRHYNWHRRRDDSLQHGFMRFSPSDDCSPHYPGCVLNFRNTHYHCMQQGCNKVYTSTSDVLGHENFHKKNATLLNEGFQRYRATEDCGTPSCEFYGQKTTHFHCQRVGCNFVFKNKYDIERHKTFHTKDDIYKREGFKKFSKHESCKYESCPYSHMLNHFHCLRPGCNFVFTTANQMHSHKRKHERLERIIRYDRTNLDKHGAMSLEHTGLHPGLPGTSGGSHPLSLVKSEASILQNVLQSSPMVVLKPGISYQALNLAAAAGQVPMVNTSMGPLPLMPPPPSLTGDGLIKSEPSSPEMSRPPPPYKERESAYRERGSPLERKLPEGFAKIEANVGGSDGEELNDSLNLPIPSEISPPYGEEEELSDGERSLEEGRQDEAWRKYLQRYTANDPCNSRCELLYKDHYHCVVDNCGQVFRSKENVKKHTRYHFMSEESSKLGFQFFPHGQSCDEKFKGCVFSPLAHYHCMWSVKPDTFCGEVIHTGSPLMRPHFEKHMRNPTLGRIRDLPEDPRDRRSPIRQSPPMGAPPVAAIRPHALSHSSSPPVGIQALEASGPLREGPLREVPWEGPPREVIQEEPVREVTQEGPRRESPSVEPIVRAYGPPREGSPKESPSNHSPQRDGPFAENPSRDNPSRDGPPNDGPSVGGHSTDGPSQNGPQGFRRDSPSLEDSSKDELRDSPHVDSLPRDEPRDDPRGDARDGLSMGSPPSDSPPREAVPGTTPAADVQPRDLLKAVSPKEVPPKESPVQDVGYEVLDAGKCPRENCPLSKVCHHHCTKAECQYATENLELMLDHKTNERLIFDSFKQCSRKQDCRRPGCKYNMLHKHFHCMHQGCHFSFLQIQQMESHGRKHMRRIYGKLFNRPNSNNPGSGQQFVLPIMSMSRAESPPMMASPSMVPPMSPFYRSLMSMHSLAAAPPGSTTISWSAIPQPTLVNVTGITPHTSLHNPQQQLLLPISSLAGQPMSTDTPSPSNAYGRYGEASSPPSAASPGRSYSPRKRPLTLVIEDPGAPSGYKRYKRGPLDSSMQEKFQRFERSEHCREPNCQYNLNTTHYHCLHEGCDYRFAGKTMMYKHAQHHERVDSIVQDDFQRYKSTADCKRSDCEFGNKNTHFHCLRCPFICTDSGKVGVHRKQHSMSQVAEKNGFKPFCSNEACPHESCKYNGKYTHYHCDKCQQAVMGLQQMDTHMRSHQLDNPAPSSVPQMVA